MRSVELFSGAGGLGLGCAKAGFHHDAMIEFNRWCCDTVRENKARNFGLVRSWPIHEIDVRRFDYSTVGSGIDLLAGGPPCQPFSVGGKHRSYQDERDMFPEVVRAIRELQPKAILIENVKGLLRKPLATYVEYIKLQMHYPEITKRPDEDHWKHLARLEQHHTSGSQGGLRYQVLCQVLNAANYGVPQRRERVFFVGFRTDLGVKWSFDDVPRTHSQDRLHWDQWVTREYWERHGLRTPKVPTRLACRLQANASQVPPSGKPWRTVRDAIHDLPSKPDGTVANHTFNPGARSYVGHTGSPFDEPAKTLKAGVHGVPGGENMLRYPNGKVRYFSVREAARLQTFPDEYVFHGAWSESMRQLGNAVPVDLGEAVARSIAAHLRRHSSRK